MDHLKEAKKLTDPPRSEGMEWAQVSATLAIAHALIALVEAIDDADVAAERAELTQVRAERYTAEREMG